MKKPCVDETFARYRKWFYFAAIYNLVWGIVNIVFPKWLFGLVGISLPDSALPFWQVVGMFVLVYAPAYYWAGRKPSQYRHIILIGFMGKVFGPIGFLIAVIQGTLPISFGIIIIFNDLIWWPPFANYLFDTLEYCGGIKAMLLGD